jgi:hypothetical protein
LIAHLNETIDDMEKEIKVKRESVKQMLLEIEKVENEQKEQSEDDSTAVRNVRRRMVRDLLPDFGRGGAPTTKSAPSALLTQQASRAASTQLDINESGVLVNNEIVEINDDEEKE